MSSTLVPDSVLPDDAVRSRQSSRLWQWARAIVGWGWRILAGTLLCFSGFLVSFFTSILVVGWLNRWMRARVLRAWWEASPVRAGVPFSELGEVRSDQTPVARPRWFLPERAWTAPALWLNFRSGLATLLCLYLILGAGCLLMLFSWEMGWLNSFNKGYEQAWLGITTGLIGSLLFLLGFLYVPMARVHAAVVGEARAFFDARLVWRLIRARPLDYLGILSLIVLAGVALERMKAAPLWLYEQHELWRLTDAQLLDVLSAYLRNVALFLFLTLLAIQAWSARVYRRALDTALREGWLEPADLGPKLYLILSRLELMPDREEPGSGLRRILRWTWRWYTRRFIFAAMLLLGLAFILKIYVGEFFNYHPFTGFMNHPLLQFPCVDYVPSGLVH